MFNRAASMLGRPVGKNASEDVQPHTDWTTFRRSWTQETRHIDKVVKAHSCVTSHNVHLVREIYEWRSWRVSAYTFLHTTSFKVFISICIFTTLVLTWVETDIRARGDGAPAWIVVANMVLLAIYTLEILLRIALEHRFFFHLAWNNADLIFVVSDLFVLILRIAAPDNDSFSWLRIARVVRIIRVARVLRFMIAFRELYMIVHGMLSISRALFWASGLMFLVLSMCSIIAVEVLSPLIPPLVESGAFEECTRCANSFDSVWNSNLLWIQSMVAGDGWGQTALPIIDKHPWSAIIFLAVLIICQLGLLNLILTVMLDTAMESRADDDAHILLEKDAQIRKAFEYLAGICADLDMDENGELSLEEIMEGWESNDEFKSTLKLMDIGRDDLLTVFQMMDQDESGAVSYHEFVDQVHKMRTSDSHTLLIFIKHYVQKIERTLNSSIKGVQQRVETDMDEVRDCQRRASSILVSLQESLKESLCTGQTSEKDKPSAELEIEKSPEPMPEKTHSPMPEQKLVDIKPTCTASSDCINSSELVSSLQIVLDRHRKEVLELLAQMQPTLAIEALQQEGDNTQPPETGNANEAKNLPERKDKQGGVGLSSTEGYAASKRSATDAEESGESSKQGKVVKKTIVSTGASDAVSKLIRELDTAGREIDDELGDVFSRHVLTSLDSVSEEISAKIESLRHQVRNELVQALEDAADKLNKDRPSGGARDKQTSTPASPLERPPVCSPWVEGNTSESLRASRCIPFICEPKGKRRPHIIEGGL